MKNLFIAIVVKGSSLTEHLKRALAVSDYTKKAQWNCSDEYAYPLVLKTAE